MTIRANVALHVFEEGNSAPSWIIILEELPTVTFTEDGLHVTAGNDDVITADFILPFDKMPRFEFAEADQTQDIETIESHVPVPFRFEFIDGQTVYVDGLSEMEHVYVYGIDGRQRSAEIEQHVHGVAVHLEQLPKGYYIIRTENQSFKIYKK